jgi:hypothetical protein
LEDIMTDSFVAGYEAVKAWQPPPSQTRLPEHIHTFVIPDEFQRAMGAVQLPRDSHVDGDTRVIDKLEILELSLDTTPPLDPDCRIISVTKVRIPMEA